MTCLKFLQSANARSPITSCYLCSEQLPSVLFEECSPCSPFAVIPKKRTCARGFSLNANRPMYLTLPGIDTSASLHSAKHSTPIVSNPLFSSTCSSAQLEVKVYSPIDFRPRAALRSTCLRSLHRSNARSSTRSILDGRIGLRIPECAKQPFSNVLRPSLNLTERI